MPPAVRRRSARCSGLSSSLWPQWGVPDLCEWAAGRLRQVPTNPLPFSSHRHALERRRRTRMAVQVRQLHNDRLSGCSTSSSFNSGGTLRPHPPSRIGLARPACSAGASQR